MIQDVSNGNYLVSPMCDVNENNTNWKTHFDCLMAEQQEKISISIHTNLFPIKKHRSDGLSFVLLFLFENVSALN